MPELRSVVLREIKLPLREPFRISSGVEHQRRILLLELVDRSGARAWSECVAGSTPNYSPETIDTAWLALSRWLIPALLGRGFEHPFDVHHVLDGTVRGHPMAKAALEMGSWGLLAEIEGKPLVQLLGGSRERVEVGISLGIEETPERLVEKARAARDEGYRKIKIKIAPDSDHEFVKAVREDLGDEAPLMVDANSAYTPDDVGSLQELDRLGLIMIEQPLHHRDLLRHAQLQKRLETPLCLDESVDCVDRAEDMIALEAGKILNIKPGRVGGLTASIDIHDRCREARVPVWCGGMLESGIGRAYNVALASLENFCFPGDLSPSRRYWKEDLVDPEWTMSSDGMVTVPRESPGLGVAVDRERVESLTVRTEKFRAS